MKHAGDDKKMVVKNLNEKILLISYIIVYVHWFFTVLRSN